MVQREFNRTDRIGEFIQRELAQLIRLELKDPRLNKFITIDAVAVSRDLSFAKVYVTVLDEDQTAIEEAIVALNHASGYLRKQLAPLLKARTIPSLLFVYDKSTIEGNRLAALIESALDRSEEKTDKDSVIH